LSIAVLAGFPLEGMRCSAREPALRGMVIIVLSDQSFKSLAVVSTLVARSAFCLWTHGEGLRAHLPLTPIHFRALRRGRLWFNLAPGNQDQPCSRRAVCKKVSMTPCSVTTKH